jgi:hypothetical protein
MVPVDLPGGDNRLGAKIERMFTQAIGWQWLCHDCHGVKTQAEGNKRSALKPEK